MNVPARSSSRNKEMEKPVEITPQHRKAALPNEPEKVKKNRLTKVEKQTARSNKTNKIDAPETQAIKPQPKAQRSRYAYPKPILAVNYKALKRLKQVAVAYSHVEREFFATEAAYHAEKEVEDRAASVLAVMEKLGIPGKLYAADNYFLTNLIIDRPDLVLNLVDTLRGQDALQTTVPGALELVGIPYTGAGMRGLVIGNDRNMFKQLLVAAGIPTPPYQFISRLGTKVSADLGLPLIVKLNEGGGSVGIDNKAVKETLAAAQARVNELMETYDLPVIVERFIDGPEITVVVFEDSRKRHIFMGQKRFGIRPDGKHEFTSLESYDHPDSYTYGPVEDEGLANRITDQVTRAFKALHNRDYAKYDIRVDAETGTAYLTDCNPNTAFGPHPGLPFTEIIETLYGVKFETVLAALLSKYATKTQRAN